MLNELCRCFPEVVCALRWWWGICMSSALGEQPFVFAVDWVVWRFPWGEQLVQQLSPTGKPCLVKRWSVETPYASLLGILVWITIYVRKFHRTRFSHHSPLPPNSSCLPGLPPPYLSPSIWSIPTHSCLYLPPVCPKISSFGDRCTPTLPLQLSIVVWLLLTYWLISTYKWIYTPFIFLGLGYLTQDDVFFFFFFLVPSICDFFFSWFHPFTCKFHDGIFLLQLHNTPLCKCLFFIFSSVEGHLDCFLAIMNEAAVNIKQVSLGYDGRWWSVLWVYSHEWYSCILR